MTNKEAVKIFIRWQKFLEFADKFNLLFTDCIPESFLPYPREVLIEALNIVADVHYNSGDIQTTKDIQDTMARFLWPSKKDEEAIESMAKLFETVAVNPELKKSLLKSLKAGSNAWFEFNQSQDNYSK